MIEETPFDLQSSFILRVLILGVVLPPPRRSCCHGDPCPFRRPVGGTADPFSPGGWLFRCCHSLSGRGWALASSQSSSSVSESMRVGCFPCGRQSSSSSSVPKSSKSSILPASMASDPIGIACLDSLFSMPKGLDALIEAGFVILVSFPP